jgi:hypothetical protein
MLHNLFQWQTSPGEPVRHGDITVTPLAQAITVRLPSAWGGAGFVWNRPVAILIEEYGQTRRLPIIDVTRFAQLALLAALVTVAALARLRPGKKGS